MITLKLTDSIAEIQKKVNKASSEVINTKVSRSINYIKSEVHNIVERSLSSQPEISSLINGTLKGAFGLIENPTEIIIDTVKSSIYVEYRKYNKNLSGGGIKVSIQPSNFNNLISLQQSYVPDEKRLMNWMEWLLLMGDSIIIIDFYYEPILGKGRSSLGIMKEGSFFRVPPEFSGTQYDNFITRALTNENTVKQIHSVLEGIFK